MGVGSVEGWDGLDEELPFSKDSPPGEDGYEWGGEGGILDPSALRIGVSVGLIILSPKGFKSRPVPSSFSLILEISKGWLSSLLGYLM